MTELSPAGRSRLTGTQWLICVIAAIGFAFDIYELLMLPLVVRPALLQLAGVTPGSPEFQNWVGVLFFVPAFVGGIFGMLGGYLTDRLGRRRVLTWSILIYAFSAFASGFAESMWMLLFLRCLVFIGVCVEFVAAVAWLAEIFPERHRREKVLGYTQAFSSIGGLLVAVANGLLLKYADHLPAVHGHHDGWRYTLMSGVIPAIPLIVIRPFLPESPIWAKKRTEGTLKRPSIAQLFSPELRRTTIVTMIMFACSYGAAFGAIQQMPQIAPGLSDVKAEVQEKTAPLDAKIAALQTRIAALKAQAAAAPKAVATTAPADPATLPRVPATLPIPAAVATSDPQSQLIKSQEALAGLQKARAGAAGNAVQTMASEYTKVQEVGGLVGRFALALLVIRIVSRRALLRIFQLPGLLFVPLFFYLFLRAPNHTFFTINLEAVFLGHIPITTMSLGMFMAGLFTVAQFSFWGNYLPQVYPLHLRGTGESFAANIGGRMIGTSFAWVTATAAGSGLFPAGTALPVRIATTAAGGCAVRLPAGIHHELLPAGPRAQKHRGLSGRWSGQETAIAWGRWRRVTVIPESDGINY